jgi:hypothetical protein
MQAPPGTQPQYVHTDEDRARQKRIHHAWKAYEGDFSKPFERLSNEPDMNVISNRVVEFVNAGNEFLFGKELQITVGTKQKQKDTAPKFMPPAPFPTHPPISQDPENPSPPNSPVPTSPPNPSPFPKPSGAPDGVQDFLDDTWGRKETRIPFLLRLGLNGAMGCNAFLRIVPGRQKGKFRLVEIDPAIISVKTEPQDCQTVLLYCIEYSVDEKDPASGKPTKCYYREEISRIDPQYTDDNQEDTLASGIDEDVTWSIQHWTQVTTANMAPKSGHWTPAGEPIPWPYPFAPIFSCQNLPKPNSFWGYPDVTEDLIGLNNALNLVQSGINIERKIRRLLYAPGTGEGTIHMHPGKIMQLPLPEQKIEAVQVASETASDLAFAANIRSDIDEQSAVPGVATGRVDILPRGITGIAIEMLYGPLLKKTDKKRCTYGEMLIDVSKALLVLNNMSGYIDITLNWESPLPVDDLPTVQAYVLLKSIGVSNSSIMRKLGYDPEEEMALSQVEDAQSVANNPIIQASGGTLPPAVVGVSPLPGQPPAVTPGTQPSTPLQGGSAPSGGTQNG